MSTFEQYRRDPCVALPRERLVIAARKTEATTTTNVSGMVNPRECDHNYIPIPGGDVGCTICGWWWSPEDEVINK